MDALQQGIITLIRSSLTGEELALPAGFDLEEAYPQLLRHGISTMAYDGAICCGVDKNLPVMRKLFQGYLKCLLQSEGQMKALEKVCDAFDAAGVDYMPLKGCNLKKLYPKPELRLMGDADVLIRMEQYHKIHPIVRELGFVEQVESDHELVWKSQKLLLELHKRLIPSYNKDYYRYFGDGWRQAKVQSGNRCAMTCEDEYLYLLAHFAKHYRDGGIGCRHVADLWVYRNAHPQMDEAYISKELDTLQLAEFEQNMRGVIENWFEGAEATEKTRFITDFIFQSGSWGKADAHAVSAGARGAAMVGSASKGRIYQGLRMVFPSAPALQSRYPILKKCPALLPVFWPVRWVTALLFRKDNVCRQRDSLKFVTADKIETYQQALRYVGLDYRFKE